MKPVINEVSNEASHGLGHRRVHERQSALLMSFVTATLAVMSFLHLSGVLAGGTKPFDRSDAGIAEAVIFVVLGYGAAALLRRRPRARTVALAATGFAIAGFLVGLRFTLQGGDAIDIAYHLSALPILLIALIGLLRTRARRTGRTTLHPNGMTSS